MWQIVTERWPISTSQMHRRRDWMQSSQLAWWLSLLYR
jgi:hypothetical protein